MGWRVFAARAIGKSHIDGGTPCQDDFAHARVGDTLLAVVCDGAGSQALSHVGAKFLSAGLVEALAEASRQGEALARLPAAEFHARIGDFVAGVRGALSAQAATEQVELSAYSATLVGAVVDAQGGWFFHVGDGLAAAEHAGEPAGCTLSLPENGEYANETYFVSGEQWREHLRVTALAQPARLLALMSDGAMPFVMAKGHAAFYAPFIEPVSRFLAAASEEDGSAGLAGTLGDERTWQITGDDKALLIALWQ